MKTVFKFILAISLGLMVSWVILTLYPEIKLFDSVTDQPDSAESLTDQAAWHRSMEEHAEAESLHLRSLKIREIPTVPTTQDSYPRSMPVSTTMPTTNPVEDSYLTPTLSDRNSGYNPESTNSAIDALVKTGVELTGAAEGAGRAGLIFVDAFFGTKYSPDIHPTTNPVK